MMTKIFVVIGKTGEYSDRREWLVKAFYDLDITQAFILTLEEKSRLIQIKMEALEEEGINLDYRDVIEKYFPEMKNMDKNFHGDYFTGTHYHYEECILE